MLQSKTIKFYHIHIILMLIIVCFINNNIYCQQNNCEVLLESIKGTYTGDCVKGKADGIGKSAGTDTYEGNFKKGLPDGSGKYTWQNENYFVGNWNMGRMEGGGEMHFKTVTLQDSIVKGFWKKGKYFGPYEKQYIVVSTTNMISKVECRLTDKSGEDIFITVHQIVLKDGLTNAAQPPTITELSTITGTFYTKNNQVQRNSSLMRIQQVTFPFRAIFYLSNGENAEILFNEKGNYDVYIDTQ